jgi:hypothetical protein|tara:strand:- start:1706 stop:2329 length:624 start_codon:yes stop_codon:yes gene_type:complete
MRKKCPPGIICVENFTFLFFGLLILTVLVFLYINSNKNTSLVYNKTDNYDYKNNNSSQSGLFPRPSYSFSNVNNDILLNPYSAPKRDDRIFNNDNYNGPKIPINQPTQSVDTNYRQIGILTRVNGGETILPLMGRPLFSNRDKWNFYTMNDKNNMIKLPITFKNKSCTSDQGCDNVYNGDTLYVEGYNDLFRVTVYDNNTMQYIPYL